MAEIGVWDGKHAVAMIRTAAMLVDRTDIVYHGFDAFEALSDDDIRREMSKRPPSRADVARRLEATGATVYLHVGFSRVTLREFAETRGNRDRLDFVLIDGGHSVETIASDWHWVRKIIGPRTVVLFDDYYHNAAHEVGGFGCQGLVDGLDRSEYDVDILPIVNSFKMEWGRLHVGMAKVIPKTPLGTASGR